MKILLFVVSSLLIVVAPVSAQASAQSVSNGEITPAGLLGAAVLIAVAVIGGVFALMTRYVDDKLDKDKTERKAEVQEVVNVAELIKAINTLGTSIGRVLDDQFEERKDQTSQRAIVATSQKDMATVLSGMLDHMKTVLTKDDADKQEKAIRDNSNAARDAINEHTDKVGEDTVVNINLHTDQRLEIIEKDLKSLNENVATIASLHRELEPIRHDLERALLGIADLLKDRAEVQKKIDTNRNLNPQIAIDAERARGITSQAEIVEKKE